MNVRQGLGLASLIVLMLGCLAAGYWWTGGHRPTSLTLSTGPDEGNFHSLGQLIADAVHDADPNLTIRVTASDGSQQNMEMLGAGETDLAIVQNDTEPGGGDVKTLIPLHRGVLHFLVPVGSEIRDLFALCGKNVCVGMPQSGNLHVVEKMLAHFGIQLAAADAMHLSDEQVRPVYRGIRDCEKLFAAGQIDAALFITGLNSPSLTHLVRQGNVRYVALAHTGAGNEVDGFAATYPYVERYTIPRYVYPVHDARHGLPAEPRESFALRSSLVCRGDLSDHLANTIVAAIVSHRTAMMRHNQEARDITEHFEAEEIQFPLHHGAVAFYQRLRPSFWERYSEPMALLLSVTLALGGVITGFNKWLLHRKKNRIDSYYSRLDALLEEMNSQTETAERLDAIEQELLVMRHDAVRALVGERLLADESFQIFQSLLTDCHHQLSLQRQSLAKKV